MFTAVSSTRERVTGSPRTSASEKKRETTVSDEPATEKASRDETTLITRTFTESKTPSYSEKSSATSVPVTESLPETVTSVISSEIHEFEPSQEDESATDLSSEAETEYTVTDTDSDENQTASQPRNNKPVKAVITVAAAVAVIAAAAVAAMHRFKKNK